MKRIGYVYRYDEDEQKGILVYGHWKNPHSAVIQDKPIKFTLDHCKSPVKTGQLVYFELLDNNVTNIERASFANFDKNLFDDIITCKNDYQSDWYDINTQITFEYLGDIIIPAISDNDDKLNKEYDGLFVDDELYDECDDFWDILDDNEATTYHNINLQEDEVVQRPIKIDELFEYFGKYEHRTCKYKDDSSVIDFLDISFWIDEHTPKDMYFGSTVCQFLYLCDIFIKRKQINENGEEFIPKRKNDCISKLWKLLISKFSDSELRMIISKCQILQPILPESFCQNNLDVLSDKYGMPSVDICKAYNRYLISKTKNVFDYETLRRKFYIYENCNVKHLEGEGVPMCKMGKSYIKVLSNFLDIQFQTVISVNVKLEFEKITSIKFDSIIYPNMSIKNAIIIIGKYLDVYEQPEKSLLKLKDFFEALPTEFQEKLKQPTRDRINETLIEISKYENTLPSDLMIFFDSLKDWINISTPAKISSIVNKRYVAIESLSEIKIAYDMGYVSCKQYYKAFWTLTENFNILQFGSELMENGSFNKPHPIIIQWHIMFRIIKLLNFHSLIDLKYEKITEYEVIIDIKSFFKWLHDQNVYGRIDSDIIEKSQKLVFKNLSKEEKWELFEEDLTTTPGFENIKEKLAVAYNKKDLDSQFFKKASFQNVMSQDALSDVDMSLKFLIANHLDAKHLKILQDNSCGAVKLYAWICNPDMNYDWDLIRTFLSTLPGKQQIKLIKYLVFLIAKGKLSLSINDLNEEFITAEKRPCLAVCYILYILKEKITTPSISIKSNTLNRLFGEPTKNIQDLSDFFYVCHGHLTLTYMQTDKEYKTYNGYVDKISIQDRKYYVVTFYDVPHDIYGCEVNYLGNEPILLAKEVLDINLKTKKIDGTLVIDVSEEIALKEYILAYEIEDHCSLLDCEPAYYQSLPIYTNLLRPYDDERYNVCRGTNCQAVDSIYGLPFYWCNKKICARRCHYIQPISCWEKYKFSDMLFYLSGSKKAELPNIWMITMEISQFIHEYLEMVDIFTGQCAVKNDIISRNIDISSEIGCLSKGQTIIQDIYDYDDESDDSEEYMVDGVEQDAPTCDRYGGSYAQDEMGYSDDDIDTIFDGDPDAYWNID